MEDRVAAFAESLHWTMTYDVPRNLETATDHEVTWEVEDGLALDYLESYLTGDCCVLALGENLDDAERLMESIESDFEESIFELGELLDGVDHARSGPDLARSLIRAGLGAPLGYDEEFFATFVREASADSEPRIREFALCSMVYTEWPQFVPVLKEIKSNDLEERVRDRAAIVLKAYDAAGLGGVS
jgi:hypothetical protein